jgi:DNA-binding transcriptional MerR regulator
MRMSDVERQTGVNRETIRVYVRKGLIPPPEKVNATNARYTVEHVRAVLAVRNLQREHHMTLDQIAAMLQGDLTRQRVEAPAFQHLEDLVAARLGYQSQEIPLSALAESNPHAERDARGLAVLGALDIVKTADGPAVSYSDARLVEIWAQMRQAGFVEAKEFFPEVLDHYTKSAAFLAHAEVRRFMSRTQGRVDDETAAEMLRIGLPLMLDFFGLLRNKFFIRYLTEMSRGEVAAPVLDDPPPPPAAE